MKILISDEVLTQNLDGEIVLLDLQSEQYFGLDDVGSAMWNALAQTGSVEAAFQQLQSTYDIEPDRLHQDLLSLVGQLRENGLLKEVEA